MITFSNDIFFSQVESDIAAGRSVRFRVKGHSMYPLLRNIKDEVTLTPLQRDPAIMDIVLFRYNGIHVLHRIIAIKDDIYIIQGDGNCLPKESCSRQDIVGVVTEIHKDGKKNFATTSNRLKIYNYFWINLRFCRRYMLAVLKRFYK